MFEFAMLFEEKIIAVPPLIQTLWWYMSVSSFMIAAFVCTYVGDELPELETGILRRRNRGGHKH